MQPWQKICPHTVAVGSRHGSEEQILQCHIAIVEAFGAAGGCASGLEGFFAVETPGREPARLSCFASAEDPSGLCPGSGSYPSEADFGSGARASGIAYVVRSFVVSSGGGMASVFPEVSSRNAEARNEPARLTGVAYGSGDLVRDEVARVAASASPSSAQTSDRRAELIFTAEAAEEPLSVSLKVILATLTSSSAQTESVGELRTVILVVADATELPCASIVLGIESNDEGADFCEIEA